MRCCQAYLRARHPKRIRVEVLPGPYARCPQGFRVRSLGPFFVCAAMIPHMYHSFSCLGASRYQHGPFVVLPCRVPHVTCMTSDARHNSHIFLRVPAMLLGSLVGHIVLRWFRLPASLIHALVGRLHFFCRTTSAEKQA